MTHKSIAPATSDERGQISDILYKSNFQHAAIIESKRAGLIRGNHTWKVCGDIRFAENLRVSSEPHRT